MSKKGCCQNIIEIITSNHKLIKGLLKFKIQLLINFKIMINGNMKEDILLENILIYDLTIFEQAIYPIISALMIVTE